ncbi:response regulator transcription factor [Nocardioides sp. T2.26MG-1]|uniref:response regulator transcription factor n=1 Tax=Nocardioides sp. T2.26MG-1 TaxID=3041166 RepID=UPI0024775B9F|nr:response regulator transcription factor [Nocardioides sp. T2.26MG-1]CAI9403841.1 Transcriptional regulatory protein SrrA [Nocardioides sp. T2.26MG-1]
MAAGGVRALVVDDEADLRRVVAAYLADDGFEVWEAADGTTALELARAHQPQLVVLDLKLPDIDGIEVCRRLRTFTDAYVVMLTARAEEVDTLIGLSVGADDYLTKPFSPRILLARIHTVLRRPRSGTGEPGDHARDVGDLRLDPDAHQVSVAGEPVDLTPTEFDILATLSSRSRQVWSRRQLLEAVWGPGWVGDERIVDVHVAHLRAKLGPDAATRYVVTVRGVGFRMGPG